MSHAASPEAASNNFLVPNGTFIVELLLFLLILGIMSKLVLPRLQSALRGREAMVAGQLEDSEEARRQLAEAQQAYQMALNDARTEAARIRESARDEAQRTIEETRAQAQEEAARIIARGEEQLRGQREAIVRELRAEIGGLAVGLSEKIVDQPLAKDSEVSGTVDNFLAGLSAQDAARSGVDA
jgi:F-type H+-transporting ATPase subunit b